jgi:hypothetical protein
MCFVFHQSRLHGIIAYTIWWRFDLQAMPFCGQISSLFYNTEYMSRASRLRYLHKAVIPQQSGGFQRQEIENMLSLPCAQLPSHTRVGTSARAKSSGVIAEMNGMYESLGRWTRPISRTIVQRNRGNEKVIDLYKKSLFAQRERLGFFVPQHRGATGCRCSVEVTEPLEC